MSVTNKGAFELSEAGGTDWSANTIKCALVTSSFPATHVDLNFINEASFTANELSGGGYTRVTMTCTGPTEDDANDRVNFNASDVTFTSLGSAAGNPAYAVIFKDTGTPATSPILAVVALTAPPSPNGGDYTIQWNGGSGPPFYLSTV